jgi:hypothetical protein
VAKHKRGGRRPGAGAPRGNLNALKHGRRSRQFAEFGALLVMSPQAREALERLSQRFERKRMTAEEAAAALLARLIEHARDIARGVDSPGPFRNYLKGGEIDEGLNASLKHMNDALSTRKASRRHRPNANPQSTNEIRGANNQSTRTNPTVNQPSDTDSSPNTHD